MVKSCLKNCLYFLSFILLTPALKATSPDAALLEKALPLSQSSKQIQSAIKISAYVYENQIQVGLDKQSKGHLLINVELETLQSFHLYEDRLSFWSGFDKA